MVDPAGLLAELHRSLDRMARAHLQGDIRAIQTCAELTRQAAQTLKQTGEENRARAVLAIVECVRAISQSDIDQALPLAQDAHGICISNLAVGDPIRVRALLLLAELHFRSGQHDAALQLYDQADEESTQQPACNGLNHVESLFFAASLRIRREQGGEEAAARLLAEAWRVLPAGDLLAANAQQLVAEFIWGVMVSRARATAQTGIDGVEAAEQELRNEIDEFRTVLLDAQVDPPLASLGLLGLAQFQWEHQRFEAIDSTLALLGPAPSDIRVAPFLTASYWNLLGLLETERSNFALAREHFERAMDICTKARLTSKQALVINHLGLLLLRQGDYKAAGDMLRVAVERYANEPELKRDPQRAKVLVNLAKALEGLDQYPEAAALLEEARSLAESSQFPDPYTLSMCLNNLGINRYGVGAFDDARRAFERARLRAAPAFGEDHLHVAEIDVNLAWIAQAQNQPEQAEAKFRAALAVARSQLGNDHYRTAEIQSYLARILAERGQAEQARELLIDAMRWREQYLTRTVRTALSERDRLAFVQALRVHPESSSWPGVLDTYLDLAPRLEVPVEQQYRRLLAWKGIVGRHTLPSAEELEDLPEVRALADHRARVLHSLRIATFAKPTPGRRAEHSAALAAYEAELNDLERALQLHSQHFQSRMSIADPTPAQLAAVLPPQTALLDIIQLRRYRPRRAGESLDVNRFYTAFLIRANQAPLRIDLGDALTLDNAVLRWRSSLARETPPEDEAGELATLVSALMPHLAGVELLVIAGDGLLQQLPFAALPRQGAETRWIDQMAFASVPTAQSLLARRTRSKPSGGRGLLAVGGVEYGAPEGAIRYPPLDETRDEVEAVASLYRHTHHGHPLDLLVGSEASKPAVRRLLPQHRFIHLATHGFFRSGRQSGRIFDPLGASAQLDSGLVLAGANLTDDDHAEAILTAEEIGSLDLHDVELVMLSACDTGLGHISAGQGVIGLIGALDRAGVGTTVGALWKVQDDSAAALASGFYRHLWSGSPGIGPAQALRAVQREMIAGTLRAKSGESFAHPKHWAAFVVGGDAFGPKRLEE
jgi:CHAT domain-containing protein/tetratricopeptide (TPR) repeat protein